MNELDFNLCQFFPVFYRKYIAIKVNIGRKRAQAFVLRLIENNL